MFGETALLLAATYGHKEAVGLLLDQGANKDHKTTDKLTALDIAQKNGHKEVVRILKRNVLVQGAVTVINRTQVHSTIHTIVLYCFLYKSDIYSGFFFRSCFLRFFRNRPSELVSRVVFQPSNFK